MHKPPAILPVYKIFQVFSTFYFKKRIKRETRHNYRSAAVRTYSPDDERTYLFGNTLVTPPSVAANTARKPYLNVRIKKRETEI